MRKPIISWTENTYKPWTPLWVLQEALLCLKEQRLPKRCLVRKKVFPGWYYSLKIKNALTKKIKVGFGPVVEGEYNIGVRKSRIDPIVNCINTLSDKYSAGIFFDPGEMAQFDVIVIVKEFNKGLYPLINDLKSKQKVFVFDIVDNPFCTDPKSESYHDNPDFLRLMDGIIASNPLQSEDVKELNPHVVLIEHPIINHEYSQYPQKTSVDIIWQGYFCNAEWMFRLHDVLKKIREESHIEVNIIYHSNHPSQEEGMIKYVKWNIRDWQHWLARSDIGIVIKPSEDDIQRRKPSNKVISYMAAGLPVVCTPTEADKLVIEHGETGYFAYTDEEWYTYLKELVEHPELRKTMGTAARKFVLENFSTGKIMKKYIDLFDRLM
ncbi:MAG: glycosyltransferase [Candidatus Hodarchaeota archaeon]